MNVLKNKVISFGLICMLLLVTLLSEKVIKVIDKDNIETISENSTFLIGGECVGIKLLANGVLVMKNEREDLELNVGDVILRVNGKSINTSEELENIVKSSEGKQITFSIIRNNTEKDIKATPIFDELSKEYRMNIWVKDSSAGVGTVTFFEKNSMSFAALGHGITETEESYIVPIETGAITYTDIYSIKRGYSNEPGEVRGTVTNSIIGSIITNTNKGIYGKVTDKDYLKNKEEIEILSKEEIKEGTAQIYTSIDRGKAKYYEIKIEKVLLNSTGNKNMIIKVTDEELLELTGGIIQGMSGSPIIQDGKLIGAVTHVLLNDPTKGYGVFIENMIEDMAKIE